MKVYIATDHAGFDLKEEIKVFLLNKGYDVEDFGAYEYDKEDDYPDFIKKAAKAVSESKNNDFAIIFGGSGQGEAMVANRFKNVRAAVLNCENIKLVKLAREHNDANILSIGARFLSKKFALKATEEFLETKFSEAERHKRRLKKLENLSV